MVSLWRLLASVGKAEPVARSVQVHLQCSVPYDMHTSLTQWAPSVWLLYYLLYEYGCGI